MRNQIALVIRNQSLVAGYDKQDDCCSISASILVYLCLYIPLLIRRCYIRKDPPLRSVCTVRLCTIRLISQVFFKTRVSNKESNYIDNISISNNVLSLSAWA